MTDATWYAKMAEAMKTREKCLTAIAKWQENLAAAELLIQQLRESDVADEAPEEDPVEETEPATDPAPEPSI